MRLDLSNIQKNIVHEAKEQKNVVNVALKTLIPAIIGTVVLKSLATEATKMASESLVTIVSNGLNISGYGALGIGALLFYKGLSDYYDTLEGKKVEYIKIPKKDFDDMSQEILNLRTLVEQTQNQIRVQ